LLQTVIAAAVAPPCDLLDGGCAIRPTTGAGVEASKDTSGAHRGSPSIPKIAGRLAGFYLRAVTDSLMM